MMDIEDHSMRPAQFAELQRLNQLHREKLRQIAERKGLSSVPGQPDIIPSKVAERSRRTRLEQERCADIERQNHKLLSRLERITYGRKSGDADAMKVKSLNFDRRKREQERINRENAMLLKRLEQSRSAFSSSHWKKDDEKHRKLVQNLQQFRTKPRFGASDDSQDMSAAEYSALRSRMVSAADDSRSDSRYARDTSTGFSSPDDMHRRAESVPVRRALPRGPLPPIHATSTAADTRLTRPSVHPAYMSSSTSAGSPAVAGTGAVAGRAGRGRDVSPTHPATNSKTFQETLQQLRQQVILEMQSEERRPSRRVVPPPSEHTLAADDDFDADARAQGLA